MLKQPIIIISIIGGGIAILVLIGFTIERVAQTQVISQFLALGQLVDVGEYQMHVYVTGEATGKPTVILEAGNGGFSTQWVHLQNELSQYTQVVSYDRAGYGWSEPAPYPPNLTRNAHDLQTALDTLKIKPPYLLVGHSMGGLFNLSYHAEYPDNIVGMVFLDSTHPNMWEYFPDEMRDRQNSMSALMRIMQFAANFGVMRIFNPLTAVVVDLPEAEQNASLALSATPQYIKTFLQEAEIVSNLPQSMPPISDLSDIPLVVFSANSAPEGQTMPEGIFDIMHSLHQQLAEMSNYGEWYLLDGANHYSIVMAEEYVSQIAEVIRHMLAMQQVQ